MDYDFLDASNGAGDAALMHVTQDRIAGSTTIKVDTVTNVPQKFIATYGTLGPDGFMTAASKRDFRGHLSGADLIIDAFEPGNADNGNTGGQIVIIKPNTGWTNRVSNFIKNMTGFGTAENLTVADLVADDITADTATLAGALGVGGSIDVTGNIVISGTSRLVAGSIASAATITPDKQVYNVTALAVAATIATPTWAAADGMVGRLRIKDNGTARALTWPANWVAIGITLPTATTANKYMYISYEYVQADNKFHVLGVARQA